MTDLKPCPFCGSSDVATQHCDEVSNVCCDNCHAGYWTSDGEDAESIWNNRVSPWRSLKDDPPTKAPVLIRRGQSAAWCFGAQIAPWLPVSGYFLERGYTEWMEIPT